MLIRDKLNSGELLFSFEFFPPKTQVGEENLWSVLKELVELRPSYVSVTYGAGGSTRNKTVDISHRIQSELKIDAMTHLTCVGSTRDELAEMVDSSMANGLHNVLALRGDPPKGQKIFAKAEGGFGYADELTAFLKNRYGDRVCLGGACYPEGHIEAPSLEKDLDFLKRKVDAGAEFLITQLFFDNRVYFDFVDRARGAGIHVPIIPGIMPVQNFEQIKRFTAMCGASIPSDLYAALEKRADSPERVQELGVVHATIQSLGLIQGGAPGIHFYTLNRSAATRDILGAIRVNGRI
ncbi:MAG: methylenetetrahydrofolate reductase [NAD(P)H] [Myxococcales bacterium]|nr:methylenetetrahydrofolate reductase [NAD(P)H] [Myxococcales bacterium]